MSLLRYAKEAVKILLFITIGSVVFLSAAFLFVVASLLAGVIAMLGYPFREDKEQSFGEYFEDLASPDTDDFGLSPTEHRARYWWLYLPVTWIRPYRYVDLATLDRRVWPPFWGHRFKLGESE